MTFLNKTGLALRLLVAGLMLVMVACQTAYEITNEAFAAGGTYFNRLRPCNYAGEVIPTAQYFNCEMEELHYFVYPDGSKELFATRHREFGSNGTDNGLSVTRYVMQRAKSTWCHEDGERKADYTDLDVSVAYSSASSHEEVERICEPIRLAMEQKTAETIVVSAEQRLDACDSFGFKRGTEAHAECAMKLYMNEQNQGTANAVTSSNNQQTAALARQQAIQEATIKEQERIRQLEAALRGVQAGIEIMTGTSTPRRSSQTHSQTYNINGQIIRCTTTGSITTCL